MTVLGFGFNQTIQHVEQIPTKIMLGSLGAHWCRDRSRGDLLPIELAVKKMTSETADLWGLHDRGRLQPGMKADVNVIDFDNLKLHMPEFWYDLPDDARRLVQRADGYAATIVSGQVIMRDGEPTGARPGALIRGEQPAPI